jgi:hypothetical protein
MPNIIAFPESIPHDPNSEIRQLRPIDQCTWFAAEHGGEFQRSQTANGITALLYVKMTLLSLGDGRCLCLHHASYNPAADFERWNAQLHDKESAA